MDPILLFRTQPVLPEYDVQHPVQAVLDMPVPAHRYPKQLRYRFDAAQIVSFFYCGFSRLFSAYALPFISYGLQFFPLFPVFKPFQAVCDEVFLVTVS